MGALETTNNQLTLPIGNPIVVPPYLSNTQTILKDTSWTLDDIEGFDLDPTLWQPIRYFPYRTLIAGTWMSKAHWEIEYPTILPLWDYAKECVRRRGYYRWQRLTHMVDNYAAVELGNREGDAIYIGQVDQLLCLGGSLQLVPDGPEASKGMMILNTVTRL